MVRLVGSSAVVLFLLTFPAFGTAVVPDGSWHEFLFGLATSAVTSCGGGCVSTTNPVAEQTSSPPWTWTGPARLTILDLFQRGDRFEGFDGASLGTTSVVVNDGAGTCSNNIGCALGDATYSRLVVDIIGTGPHSLTINVIQNALGTSGGAAVFQLVAIPEPGTIALFGSGILLLALGRLRKK